MTAKRKKRGGIWILVHFLLRCAYYGVTAALGMGAYVLFRLAWPRLWSTAATAEIAGGVALCIVALVVFIVVPGRIERLTGREVSGVDGSGASMGDF